MSKHSLFPLPLFKSPSGGRFKFAAHFNGSIVVIDDPIAILNVHSNGHFGQKSKNSEPVLDDDMVLEEESDDDEEQLHEEEFLYLMPEEAVFLQHLNCLQLTDSSDSPLDVEQTWKKFNLINDFFIQNYIVYHYYKSRNWIVKSGLQFGGEFVLYQRSPAICHSTYIVIIDVEENTDCNDSRLQRRRSMDLSQLLGMNRVSEAVAKQVMIARIRWSQDKKLDLDDPACIKEFEIEEILLSRLQSTREYIATI